MKATAKPNSLNLGDETQSQGKLRKAEHSGWSRCVESQEISILISIFRGWSYLSWGWGEKPCTDGRELC